MADNYSCTNCGRGFSRKASAIRHVKTVEKDKSAGVIPTPQYHSELRGNVRLPPVREPTYKGKANNGLAELNEISKKMWDRLVDRCVDHLADKVGLESNEERYYGLLLVRDFPDHVVDRSRKLNKLMKLIARGEAALFAVLMAEKEKSEEEQKPAEEEKFVELNLKRKRRSNKVIDPSTQAGDESTSQ